MAKAPEYAAEGPAPLSILHLCSLTRWNGTVHLAAALCRRQAEAGHRVMVGAREGAKLIELTRGRGIEVVEGLSLLHGFYPRAFLRDVRRIRAVMRERDVDVVHGCQSAEKWIAAAAVRGRGAALFHTRSIMKPVRRHAAKRWLDRLAGGTFVTGKRIARMVREASSPRARIFPLREGVDIERFHPAGAEGEGERRALRRELGIADDHLAVVNVGRLEAVKGQSIFLRALAKLPPRVHGVIAGDGSLREALEQETRELGIGERVHLLGRREDVPRVLAACDVYVLASTGSEGSSRATLEAMATGLATVAADVGMLPDIVRPPKTGLLFEAGDVEGLARALADLERNDPRRRRLGRAARRFVERERSEGAMLEDVEQAYRDEVRRARSQARRPLDPRRDWSPTTRILECDADSLDLAPWLEEQRRPNHLVLTRDARLAESHSSSKIHPYHGAGQALRNNAEVLVLSGDSGRVLRRRHSFGHLDQILIPSGTRWWPSLLLRVLGRNLRRRGSIEIPTSGGGPARRLGVFETVSPRRKKRPRLYLGEEFGAAAMFAAMKERGVRYLVLRWFDRLPEIEPGGDVDMVIEDDDLPGLLDILGGRVGTIPLDVYTIDGSAGHAWRGASYYPPPLARRMLADRSINERGVSVPSPEHRFLNLAFHAVYHKGARSGLPTSTPGIEPTARPKHDFVQVLGELGEEVGHRPGLTLEGVDEYLDRQGWRPPRDTLRKWNRVNPWIKARFFAGEEGNEPPGIVAFVLRSAAVEYGLVEELKEEIRGHGFTILDEKRLDETVSAHVAQRTRGGNWGKGGGFAVDPGPPAHFVIAHDPHPLRLTRRYRRRYPDMDNGRLVCKRQIRDAINQGLAIDRRTNFLHASDNAAEAWEYIRLAMPEREEAIREMLSEV
jgi:glycosyltransferase involved in cell wall biosynthesis